MYSNPDLSQKGAVGLFTNINSQPGFVGHNIYGAMIIGNASSVTPIQFGLNTSAIPMISYISITGAYVVFSDKNMKDCVRIKSNYQ